MDKLKFLELFENTRSYRFLCHEELKLYLFLLMYADEIEVERAMNLGLLRRVMGGEITLDKLKAMASNLKRHGLADIIIAEGEKELEFVLHEIADE